MHPQAVEYRYNLLSCWFLCAPQNTISHKVHIFHSPQVNANAMNRNRCTMGKLTTVFSQSNVIEENLGLNFGENSEKFSWLHARLNAECGKEEFIFKIDRGVTAIIEMKKVIRIRSILKLVFKFWSPLAVRGSIWPFSAKNNS